MGQGKDTLRLDLPDKLCHLVNLAPPFFKKKDYVAEVFITSILLTMVQPKAYSIYLNGRMGFSSSAVHLPRKHTRIRVSYLLNLAC